MHWTQLLVFEQMKKMLLLGRPTSYGPLPVSFSDHLNPHSLEPVVGSELRDEPHLFGFVLFVSFGELGSRSQQMD